MMNKISLIALLSLLCVSCLARNQVTSAATGGGVISGEPVVFEIVTKCDGRSMDPTFSDTAVIEMGYESVIDSYTLIVTTSANKVKYYPAKLVTHNFGESFHFYGGVNFDDQPKLGVVSFGYKSELISYTKELNDYTLDNCVASASKDW